MEEILRKNFNNNRKNDHTSFSSNKSGLTVEVRNGDFNGALRRFKKKVQEAGIIQEVRERGEYVKPSEKRAKAKAAGIARWKKKQAKENEKFGGGKY
jgi:small subunit ribosomal protein S21|tara:strand:- start:723 stop:1013 length:291 start_codon:yes stop_codon:yes gene_type:complete